MKKTGKQVMASLLLLPVMISLTACGAKKSETRTYKDGSYEAESALKDEHGGYGKIKLVIREGKISEAEFHVYKKDGTEKDQSYGTEQNEGLYKIAQASLKAIPELEENLRRVQDPEAVDTVTGATWNTKLFKDAAARALAQAGGKTPEEGSAAEELSLATKED